jgi:hypothetical protein
MELLTFSIDISSFYPHILIKMHAQFNTIINDNSEAVQTKLGDRDVTFTRVLAVTRKWNVAGVYLHLLYNMRSKQGNLLIIVSPNFAYMTSYSD